MPDFTLENLFPTGINTLPTRLFGPQPDGSFFKGLEFTISNANWSNTSLKLILDKAQINFVPQDRTLAKPLPPIPVTANSIVVWPEPAVELLLESIFETRNRPTPMVFIYEDIRVRFNGENMPTPGGPLEWFSGVNKAALKPSSVPGLQIIPDDDKIVFKVLTREGEFADPIFFLKFLQQHAVADGGQLTDHFNQLVNTLPPSLTLNIRDEWNQPMSTSIQLDIAPTNGSAPQQTQRTTTRGAVRITDPDLVSGTYTLSLSADELVAVDHGVSSSNQLVFTVSAPNLSDYITVRRIKLLDWFVGQEFGHAYTSDNDVKYFTDGKEYFSRIHSLLQTNFDYVFFTNWRFDFDFDLLEIPPAQRGTLRDSCIGNMLMSPVRRDKIFGILWDQTNPKAPVDPFVYERESFVNNEAFVALNRGIDYSGPSQPRHLRVFQDKSLDVTGIAIPLIKSHHQKTFITKQGNNIIAFCGGLDLAFQRWDDHRHRPDAPNRFLPEQLSHPVERNSLLPNEMRPALVRAGNGPMQPWHDVQLEISGPAAKDIDTNFRERWVDGSMDANQTLGELIDELNNQPDLQNPNAFRHQIKAALPDASGSQGSPGKMFVKIARTLHSGGSYSMIQNIIHCIRKAQNLIYIEDQYLTSYHVATELRQRLLYNPMLNVIIVTGWRSDLPGAITRRNRFIEIMQLPGFTSQAGIFHLQNKDRKTNTYVHSKMMIVDDIWAYVGSANLNHRSFASDSEVGAMVVDGQLFRGRRKFALELRKSLWEEHFRQRLPYSDLLNYANSKAMWDHASNSATSSVIELNTDPTGQRGDAADSIVDPWSAGSIPDLDNPGSSFEDHR